MDTNVILARFAPKDPLYSAAKSYFSTDRENRIISPVSLLEMNAVLSREDVGFDVPEFLAREPGHRRTRAISESFIRLLNLRLESLGLTVRLRVGEATVSMPIEYAEALKNAAELGLKALDLLHLSYAGLINALRVRINNFVTSDREILERSVSIAERMGINAIHPRDATP